MTIKGQSTDKSNTLSANKWLISNIISAIDKKRKDLTSNNPANVDMLKNFFLYLKNIISIFCLSQQTFPQLDSGQATFLKQVKKVWGREREREREFGWSTTVKAVEGTRHKNQWLYILLSCSFQRDNMFLCFYIMFSPRLKKMLSDLTKYLLST